MVESQKVMGTGRSDPTPPSEGMGALIGGTDYNTRSNIKYTTYECVEVIQY